VQRNVEFCRGKHYLEAMARSRFEVIRVTDRAAERVREIVENAEGSEGIRIGIKKGGCAGMEYTMDYVAEIAPHDEVIEQNGARVMIAPMAQMFLFGTEIDYETGLLESGFRFTNPNVVDSCGCGESIKFAEM
jgi:iron-sulfur cluster assembly protein